MTNYNLILITTHQDKLHILKLIDSVDDNIKNIKVLLVVVSQECKLEYETKSSSLTIIFIDKAKMGLSKARNIALKFLLDNNLSAEYIMFPDDDSSFNDSFFIHFPSILGSNKCYITPIYNEGTKDLYLGKKMKNGLFINEDKHTCIGSPNQVILYNKFKDEIKFNEDLGIGSIYGSCEDYDLFIRLNRFGARYFFVSNIFSFHPSKKSKNLISKNEIIKRYKSYSPGFVYIIKKYKKYKFIFSFLIRPIGGIVIKVLKFDFKMTSVYGKIFMYRIELLFKNLV